MKILVVDDNPQNLSLLEVLLRGHGYEVTSARHGAEALEKAVQDRFDLIISDILMPHMDGFQLCRAVKTHPQLHDIAFVFYSAMYTDPRDHAFALSLGAEKFVVKPQDPGVLLAAVQEVMRQRLAEKPVPPLPIVDEAVYMQGHNERLIHQLEAKMLELEEAHRRLAESEAQYRAFVEQANDAVMLFDPCGQVRLVNPQFCTWFGYSQEDATGLHLRGLIHPDEVDRVLVAFQGLVAGERLPVLGAVRCLTKTGDILYADMNANVIVRDGACMGVQAILRDIAERQQAEQVLYEQATLATLESEVGRAMTRSESLAEILGQCTDAMVQHLDAAFARIWTLNDTDNVLELQASAGLYTHINGAHARVPVGQFKIGLIAHERQPHFTNTVTTDPRVGDKEWARREGLVSFAGYPLMVGDRLVGVIAMFARYPLSAFVLQALGTIANNIALGLERLHARHALRESELRFRQLTEHIHEVFYLYEAESGETLYISPAYEQIWGRSVQAVSAQLTDFIEAVHPEDRPGVYAMFDQLKQGKNSEMEYRIVRPNGEVRWILARAFPFRDNTQSGYRVAGVAEDITARQQAEEALRQMNDVLEQRVAERTAALSAANSDLAKATRLKDEFLASMSHELRTPLNAILGLSEALQERVYGPLTDKQDQSLRHIEESGRHLLALITDILDLSKIEAGKVELLLTPVDVEGVCQASLRLIRESAQKKHLTMACTVDGTVPTLVADERRLKQMLVNLLSNAVKFTPAEGRIGLDVTGHPAEQMVSLSVWDTGIGIAATDRARLFQPFVQLDSSLARHHAGTGLGLSLVARLADLHGGRVTCESIVGQGSRFSVVLPWRMAPQDSAPARRLEAPAPCASLPMARLERVLVVEDIPTHAEQLVRYLQDLAVNVAVYPHGDGVVDYALTTHPDVILLDLGLPDGSGWDVLARLKTEPLTRAIPVVIVSVMDEPAQGLARGAAASLVKPVTREQLQTALYQAIASQALHPPAVVVTTQQEIPETGPLLLLADDNAMNVTTVADYLHAKGYRVAVACHGVEVLERARTLRPALILMDIQMPGMDGLEATRRLRAETDPAVAATPIIALTALAMPGDRERCLAAGANAYVSKPFRFTDLLCAIEAQLKGEP